MFLDKCPVMIKTESEDCTNVLAVDKNLVNFLESNENSTNSPHIGTVNLPSKEVVEVRYVSDDLSHRNDVISDSRAPQISHVCEICQEEMETTVKLEHHIVMHAHRIVHQCTICTIVIPLQHDARTHVLTHIRKLFICSVCSLVFNHQTVMDNHKKNTSHDLYKVSYMCDGREYEELSDLKNYLLTCIDAIVEYNCALCAKQFSTSQEFVHHYINHTKVMAAGSYYYLFLYNVDTCIMNYDCVGYDIVYK